MKEIDFAKFCKLIEYLIDKQDADIIIPIGTAGEATSLSHHEKELIIETTIMQVNKRVPVIVGTGSANLDETISLTKYSEKVGAAGVLIAVPYYIRPDQDGIYHFFKTVASHTRSCQ